MNIVNMNKVEERIQRHRELERFYEYQQTCLDEALEPVPDPSIKLILQLQGPRTQSKWIKVPYGTRLYFDLMECFEGEMNRIEDELSEL